MPSIETERVDVCLRVAVREGFNVRVFIVEDEAIIAMELEDRLEQLGYEVCGHASRGEQAVRMIPSVKPHVVLMDVNLGRGMTGLAVAEQLRGKLDAPIVFLTAYTSAEIEARAGHPLHYLVKPFRTDALHASIQAAVARHRGEPPAS